MPRGGNCCCEGLQGRLQVAPLLWDLCFPFLLWLSCGSISPGLISMNGNCGKAVNNWMGPGQGVQGQDQPAEVAQP